jgi:murein DD-endopeptidase MepM/ murein hydrolase activator NlpD
MLRQATIIVLALLALPSAASAQVAAPVDGEQAGGVATGLWAYDFAVAPGRVVAGSPVVVSFRTDSPAPRVRARVTLGTASLRILGIPGGTTVERRWVPSVAPGTYSARLVVRTGGMKRVRTFPVTVEAAPAPPAPIASGVKGVFPVRGAYTFGDKDARFGAGRPGHIHQGQDITADMGTPVVSPVAGTVYWRKIQPDGAGHYLVIRDAGGVDYVFMHLVADSELVDKGDAVRAGQQIAQVGSTGSSSGPHLHFEIWPDGWYAPHSAPIDPLPQLRAWAGLPG